MYPLSVIENLHHLDQEVTAAINSLHVPATDFIWLMLSNKKIWIPMYLIIIGFMFWRLGWKRALIVVLTCAMTFLFCDQIATFIQFLVKRERPDVDAEMAGRGMHFLEPVYKKYIYGFFSAHAANAIGFAVCSWLGFKNDRSVLYRHYAWFIFIWAILRKPYLCGQTLLRGRIGWLPCRRSCRPLLRPYRPVDNQALPAV